MKFEEWFTKEREKHGKEYVMLGPFGLRNIAKLAYEQGYKQRDLELSQDDKPAETTPACKHCGSTGPHGWTCFETEKNYIVE